MNIQSLSLITALSLLPPVLGVVFTGCRRSPESVKDTVPSPTVRIHSFVKQGESSNATRIAITVERKTVELLANSGVRILSHLIGSEEDKGEFHIKGRVTERDSLFTVNVILFDSTMHEISSGSITGTESFFRTIRNVTGEAVFDALDVDGNSLQLRKSARRPTSSNAAYALYLKARQEATAERYDRAIALMQEAIGYDSGFAAAYSVIARIYKEKAVYDSAALWNQRAKRIDPDHPVPAYKESVDKEQPLKDLLMLSGARPFISIDKGIRYKRITVDGNDLSVIVWCIDPKRFTITMRMQSSAAGSYSAEFCAGPRAILAVNGGFFEIDGQYAHTPSGLIATRGKLISPLTDYGGSGIFCMKDGVPRIVWARDSINPLEYDIAFQCGPVIVEPGGVTGIYDNDFRRLNRSAIGIADGKVVLAVVGGKNGRGLSLYEFAEFLRLKKEDGGIGCDAALNLDGGASTQACFSYKKIAVAVPGLWKINSAVVVEKK